MNPEKDNSNNIHTFFELIDIIAFIVIVIFLGNWIWHLKGGFALDKYAQYGDYIGGVLGTVLAFVSIIILYWTLTVQIDSARETSKSNKEISETTKISLFEKNYTSLSIFYKKSWSHIDKTHNLFDDLQSNFNIREQRNNYEEINKRAICKFENVYALYQNILSPYFRVLYRLLEIINRSIIGEKDKVLYLKIFRCQLSEKELLLIRYNCMTSYGQPMARLVSYYNLTKHLHILNLLEFKNWKEKLGEDSLRNCLNYILQSLKKNIKGNLLVVDTNLREIIFKEILDIKLNYEIGAFNKKIKLKLIKNIGSDYTSDNLEYKTLLEIFNWRPEDLCNFLEDILLEWFIYGQMITMDREKFVISKGNTTANNPHALEFHCEISRNDSRPLSLRPINHENPTQRS